MFNILVPVAALLISFTFISKIFIRGYPNRTYLQFGFAMGLFPLLPSLPISARLFEYLESSSGFPHAPILLGYSVLLIYPLIIAQRLFSQANVFRVLTTIILCLMGTLILGTILPNFLLSQ